MRRCSRTSSRGSARSSWSARAPARIAEYSGQGTLLGWLRGVATRTALMLLGKHGEQPLPEEPGQERLMAVAADTELDYLKSRYQSELKEAFAAALAQLTSEQRNLLRLHLIDGLSIDKLGGMFQIHPSSLSA